MDLEDARENVRGIVFSLAPTKPQPSTENLELAGGLGYHSLALLELAFALEDEFDLPPIDQASAQRIRAVTDVEDYVVDQLRSRDTAESES
jgi:acyl carrier protein